MIGDIAAAVTIATLALSPNDTPLEAHHLYWGWIAEKIGKMKHWATVEKVGNYIKWDDVFNHVLPLGLGIDGNDCSPVHILHEKIVSEFKK